MVEQTKAEFGRVDILVNDAAFNKEVAFPDLDGLTHELWNHILATNLTGTFNCIKAVAPLMKAQGQGRIVNISSGAGLVPRGSSIAYAVSKAGMIHLTKCMAVALAPAVTVNCIAPGFMEGTRMTANWSRRVRGRRRRQDAATPDGGQGRRGRAARNVLPQRQRHGSNDRDG